MYFIALLCGVQFGLVGWTLYVSGNSVWSCLYGEFALAKFGRLLLLAVVVTRDRYKVNRHRWKVKLGLASPRVSLAWLARGGGGLWQITFEILYCHRGCYTCYTIEACVMRRSRTQRPKTKEKDIKLAKILMLIFKLIIVIIFISSTIKQTIVHVVDINFKGFRWYCWGSIDLTFSLPWIPCVVCIVCVKLK